MTTAASAQSERLMNARCRLMTRQPFYGHICMHMTWIPSQMPWQENEAQKTMGVRIVNGGDIQCVYYPPFVDSLTIKELYAVIQHEIEHIVRVHCVRVGGRDPLIWNYAADFTVNGNKSRPRIGYHEPSNNEVIVPLNGNILWIPEDWPQDGTSEYFYDRLYKCYEGAKRCSVCGKLKSEHGKPEDGTGSGPATKGKKKKKGEGDGEGGDGCGSACGIGGEMIDDHSVWNQSDVSEDDARQIVKDVVDQVVQKCQGHVPGHLQSAIEALSKPAVRWRELLRHYIGKHVGNQRKTYSRRNRRHDEFGIAGISRHAAATCNIIIDTSGSVSQKELEQFFTEIDSIASRAKIMVLQWDHAMQGFALYRRNSWKTWAIHGRGGTDMIAPIQYLIDESLIADVQIMLTDGECQWMEASKVNFPFITVITRGEDQTKGPGYGHVVRIKVNE